MLTPKRPLAHPDRAQRFLLAGILAVGAALRLAEFLERRSLWYDEAMLALNIASRSWLGLLHPLDYDQVAPIPFLLASRLAVALGGVNELALRCIPLLGGLLLPWLVWRAGRRIMAPGAALAAAALAACSPMLVVYSGEAKPYLLDALITCVLLLLALRLLANPTDRAARVQLGVAGALAPLVSMPAVFVLAATLPALVLGVERGVRPSMVRWALGVGASWCAAFALNYWVFYHAAADSEYLRRFWEFAMLRPGAPDLLARVRDGARGVLSGLMLGSLDAGRWGPLVLRVAGLEALAVFLLALLGAARLARREGVGVAILLAGPLVAMSCASMLGRYPVSVRLLLFAAPLVFIALAEGALGAFRFLPRPFDGLVGVATILALLAPMLVRGVMTSVEPIRRQDTRPLLAEFEQRHRRGDAIYVYPPAIPAWAFYTTDWDHPDTARLAWLAGAATSGGPSFAYAVPRGHAVLGEGDALRRPHADWVELLGVSTGRPIWHGGMAPGSGPDPGWASNEARRMRAAGSRVWMLFVPVDPMDLEPNRSELLHAIAMSGGDTVASYHRREADLYLVEYHIRPQPMDR